MTDREKAEQAWEEAANDLTTTASSICIEFKDMFKSSLKRDIEKEKTIDILNENDPYDRGWIAACKRFLELIETVEP
jgi:hypothetical protein